MRQILVLLVLALFPIIGYPVSFNISATDISISANTLLAAAAGVVVGIGGTILVFWWGIRTLAWIRKFL